MKKCRWKKLRTPRRQTWQPLNQGFTGVVRISGACSHLYWNRKAFPMEPNDPQLRDLLREWQAPAVTSSLEERVLRPRNSWSSFLLHGYIRVPVPVVCCLIGLLILAGWRVSTRTAQNAPCAADCSHTVTGAC